MITSRKVSQVNVFAGSPWEVASVKSLLKAAYIEASMKDNGLNSILISVPCEYYTAAMRVINKRKVSYKIKAGYDGRSHSAFQSLYDSFKTK